MALSIFSNRRLRMAVDVNSLQEYPTNAGVPQVPFLVQHISYRILMTFVMILSVILDVKDAIWI